MSLSLSVKRFLAALSVAALLTSGLLTPAVAAQTAIDSRLASARSAEEQRIVHVLNRLGFGVRPGDVERVRRLGLEKYVEQQLNPASLPDEALEARLKSFETLGLSNAELLAKYPNPGALLRQLQRRGELPPELAAAVRQPPASRQAPVEDEAAMTRQSGAGGANGTQPNRPAEMAEGEEGRREYRRAVAELMRERGLRPPRVVVQELQAARILRAVYSERQLQEVMVDFWTNHFNVFAQKGADRWFLTSYDRDVIRPNALGNFRALLEATAKSPAMLFYLDNFQSATPNAPARAGRRGLMRRAPRRELMGEARATGEANRRPQRMRRGLNENYARELMELHTLGVEGGYTQKDVQEVARAFTGWTIRNPRGFFNDGEAGTFHFNARLHDTGEKIVLGQKIPAGGGIEDGRKVLDILARHPSTAKFIATKLARRFVSDNPPPALISRVAAAFTKSDGDIKATLHALFGSPEFFSPEARRAKIKTPFEYAVSAIRTLGAEIEPGGAPRVNGLHQWVARMGEPLYLYQAPTGYPDTAEHWVNTGALLERLNFALALVGNRIPGVRVDLARLAGEEATTSKALNRDRIIDRFAEVILGGDLSPKSRAALARQLSEQTSAAAVPMTEEETIAAPRAARRARRNNAQPFGNPEVVRIAALVVGSPEFQRQ
jgi:uncharacterized protein (DUF1800 family)